MNKFCMFSVDGNVLMDMLLTQTSEQKFQNMFKEKKGSESFKKKKSSPFTAFLFAYVVFVMH